MKIEDIEVGMRVVPINKSYYYKSLKAWLEEEADDYAVKSFIENKYMIVDELDVSEDQGSPVVNIQGWSFRPEDLIPYTCRKRGFEYIESDIEMYKSFDGHDGWKIKLPKRATKNSAGYDIFAPFDFTLNPNEDIKIPTGLKAYMQDGEALLFFPRSSLGFKYYCRMANTIPVGDGDYYNNPDNEGHYWIKFRNEGNVPMEIKQGEAMCQAIFMPFLLADGDNFEDGEDRVGGIGSTTKVKSDV